MAGNIFTNYDFSDGLVGWTYSEGVMISHDPLHPGVIVPGTGDLAQSFGDAEILHPALIFLCEPLEIDNPGVRLQVGIEFTDGTNKSYTETDFSWYCDTTDEDCVEPEAPPLLALGILLDDDELHVKKIKITNMDESDKAAIILNNFLLYGEIIHGDEPEKSGRMTKPMPMRGMAGMNARMMESRFLDLETKLDHILERLDKQDSSPKQKLPAKDKKRK
jgi:hypothetical protein